MTLIEVMIASAMLIVITGAFIAAVVVGTRLNYTSAQHVAAFGLCKDRLEQIRAMEDYDEITTAQFPDESTTLTHAGGTTRRAIPCTRTTAVSDEVNPVRKDVTITVAWTFGGRDLQETLQTSIYLKE